MTTYVVHCTDKPYKLANFVMTKNDKISVEMVPFALAELIKAVQYEMEPIVAHCQFAHLLDFLRLDVTTSNWHIVGGISDVRMREGFAFEIYLTQDKQKLDAVTVMGLVYIDMSNECFDYKKTPLSDTYGNYLAGFNISVGKKKLSFVIDVISISSNPFCEHN